MSADRTQESYELWKSIFQRSHVSAGEQPENRSSSHRDPQETEQGIRDASTKASDRESGETTKEAFDDVSAPPKYLPTSASVSEAKSKTSVSQTESMEVAAQAEIEPEISAPAIDSKRVERSRSDVEPAKEVPEPRESLSSSPESASVFVDENAVAIVVRNRELTETEALLSAYAAAVELTGRRSALFSLILNGRTVYRRHDAFPSQASLIPGSPFILQFTC